MIGITRDKQKIPAAHRHIFFVHAPGLGSWQEGQKRKRVGQNRVSGSDSHGAL